LSIDLNWLNFSVKKVNTPAPKKAVPKLPEVLLKKRKLYADLKARRARAQVQAEKVIRMDFKIPKSIR
jgi:hypothetical protein